MDDKTYIRLIDPHTKGNGCHHQLAIFINKLPLIHLSDTDV